MAEQVVKGDTEVDQVLVAIFGHVSLDMNAGMDSDGGVKAGAFSTMETNSSRT